MAGRYGPKRYARGPSGNLPEFGARRSLQLEPNRTVVTVIRNSWGDRMRLVLQLVTRLLLVVVLCLAAATIWATVDAHRSVDRATAASAQRVSQTLEALYWRELLLRSNRTREHLLPVPDWRTIETMKLISPGICVEIEPRGAFETAALRPEQGDRQTCAALVCSGRTEFPRRPRRGFPAHQRACDHRGHRIGHRRSRRRHRAGLGAHPEHHQRRVADGDRHRACWRRWRSRTPSHPRDRS